MCCIKKKHFSTFSCTNCWPCCHQCNETFWLFGPQLPYYEFSTCFIRFLLLKQRPDCFVNYVIFCLNFVLVSSSEQLPMLFCHCDVLFCWWVSFFCGIQISLLCYVIHWGLQDSISGIKSSVSVRYLWRRNNAGSMMELKMILFNWYWFLVQDCIKLIRAGLVLWVWFLKLL